MAALDPLGVLDQNEDFTLILLGGLPGSGKSCYLEALKNRGWKIYDDFQGNARNDSEFFRDARRFDELLGDLRPSRKCVVADIRFVHAPYRADAQRTLRTDVGPIDLQLQLFENDPAQCAQNSQRSLERDVQARLDAISHWSRHYSLPAEAILLRVWRAAP
jgi:hypothetical protein